MKKSQVVKIKIPKDLFAVEDVRTKLALNEDFIEFKKTYTSKYPVTIEDNSSHFWNEKFKISMKFRELDGMTKDKINTIVKFLPKEGSKILDLGIGQGYLEQRLQEIGKTYELYGVDISDKVILRLKKRYKGEFNVGDVLKIKTYYKDNYFDAIVAIELIEHISPRKILSFFRDVRRLLKSTGVIILSTPLNENLRLMKENPSSHVREYTESILIAELKISGFKVLKENYFFAFKNLYSIKKIVAKLLPKRWKPNSVVVRAVKI